MLIFLYPALATEGRLIKRLLTRGGRRWLVGGAGDAARSPRPAVQAASSRRASRAPPGPVMAGMATGHRYASPDLGP